MRDPFGKHPFPKRKRVTIANVSWLVELKDPVWMRAYEGVHRMDPGSGITDFENQQVYIEDSGNNTNKWHTLGHECSHIIQWYSGEDQNEDLAKRQGFFIACLLLQNEWP